jgi:hypothetical protein
VELKGTGCFADHVLQRFTIQRRARRTPTPRVVKGRCRRTHEGPTRGNAYLWDSRNSGYKPGARGVVKTLDGARSTKTSHGRCPLKCDWVRWHLHTVRCEICSSALAVTIHEFSGDWLVGSSRQPVIDDVRGQPNQVGRWILDR